MIDDSAVYHQSAFLLQNFSKLTVFTIDANTSKLNVINTYESVITIKRYIAVFLFGIIGGGARYLMELLIVAPNGFPFSTLLINIIGCFFFSIMVDYIPKRFALSSTVATGLSAGLIGSFTTFSTFNLDAVKLVVHHQLAFFAIYLFCTIFGSLLMNLTGRKVSRRLLQKLEVF